MAIIVLQFMSKLPTLLHGFIVSVTFFVIMYQSFCLSHISIVHLYIGREREYVRDRETAYALVIKFVKIARIFF